jgi:hypothetical protein
MTHEKEQKPGDGKSFDMYHFFSRKDVWVAGIVILILLVYAFASHWFVKPV